MLCPLISHFLGRLELSIPVELLGGLHWVSCCIIEQHPIVVMWPIRQYNFTSEGFICMILLLFVRVKVKWSNLTTGPVI